VSDGPQLRALEPGTLPATLRRVCWTREPVPGAGPLADLVRPAAPAPPRPAAGPGDVLAALPYSSGTTGLPKGVMLTHANLVTNVFQFLAPGEEATFREGETLLLFLPLYHIYGLNVVLTPSLVAGGTLLLAPRYDLDAMLEEIVRHEVTFLPVVPPVLAALTQTAEAGRFPAAHRVRAVKSGAAPLAAGLPQRFTERTGIPVRQGYGMTEASPVTHLGFVEADRRRPDTIGPPVARTQCRVVDESGREVPDGTAGELLIRGPQVMQGYWRAPEATADALRDGWYWSGDVARRESDGSFVVVDRRKEMIKVKGFAVAPAEVEAALLEHPAVRDCGVIGRADPGSGEAPCAFVALRDPATAGPRVEDELRRHLAGRLAGYKQPRDVRFVPAIPRTPSGKILRRELRAWTA
jgi:acyl-CoA synthetase (AMP-forming)/AMP-acid ligase II